MLQTNTKGLRMKNPTHPGRFVRTVIIEPLGLTVTEAAQALGIHPRRPVPLPERAGLALARNGDPARQGVRGR